MKRFLILLVVITAVLGLTSACTSAPQLTSTPAREISATPLPSETPAPSETPLPTATKKPSSTSTSTATFTPTASETPRPSFAGFQVLYTQSTSYGLLIGFRIPGIKENFRLMVSGKEFKCDLNQKVPDQLLCYGPEFKIGQVVDLSFLALTGGDTPIYKTNYKIVSLSLPTATLNEATQVAMGYACQLRGVHMNCETEYRNMQDGTSCIVSTCYDLCGYLKSVDTCPNGSEHNGILIPTGTLPLPSHR